MHWSGSRRRNPVGRNLNPGKQAHTIARTEPMGVTRRAQVDRLPVQLKHGPTAVAFVPRRRWPPFPT